MKKSFAVRVGTYLKESLDGFRGVVRKYPVEMALALLYMVLIIIYKEKGEFWDLCTAGPQVFAFAFILNNFFRRGPLRWFYYLSVAAPALLLFADLSAWAFSGEYWMELVCLLVAMPLAAGRGDDRGFAADNWWLYSGLILSLVMAAAASVLFLGLVYCARELFDIPWCLGSRVETYFAIFCLTVGFATLALSYFERRRGTEPTKTGTMSVFLYYILTPALLAFNALFYLYLIKIAAQWSLPEGNVAAMVFAFALVAFLVKVLRELLPRKRYQWYFDNLTYIALPALVLFWVGTGYRVLEYGLTEARVYLLLCGIIMTAVLAISAHQGRGHYRTAWTVAVVLLGVFTFIRPVGAARIGICSQQRRVDRFATELDLWQERGSLLKTEVTLPDTGRESLEKLSELRMALGYLQYRGEGTYGITNIYDYGHNVVEHYDPGQCLTIRAYMRNRDGVFEAAGFTHFVLPGEMDSGSDFTYSNQDDRLTIFAKAGSEQILAPIPEPVRVWGATAGYYVAWQRSHSDLSAVQLQRAGITDEDMRNTLFYPTQEQEMAVAEYEDARVAILFHYVVIPGADSREIATFVPEIIMVKKLRTAHME